MYTETRTSSAYRPKGPRHEQIDRRAIETQLPDPRLLYTGTLLAEPEVSAFHRLGNDRRIVEQGWIYREVAVGGRARDRDVCLADAQVD
jgi:hypothetical protein